MKKYPREDLDDVVLRQANGHYVEQSMPGPSPVRDKMVSEAIATLKQARPAAKVRPFIWLC